eukprot:ctg_2324.g506
MPHRPETTRRRPAAAAVHVRSIDVAADDATLHPSVLVGRRSPPGRFVVESNHLPITLPSHREAPSFSPRHGRRQLEGDPAGAGGGRPAGHCPVADAAQDAHCGAQGVPDPAHSRVLYAQGAIRPVHLSRAPVAHPQRLSGGGRRAPVLRRPHQRAVRPRPLQTGAGAGASCAQSDGCGGARLCATAEVCRLAVPRQVAEAGRAGTHGHHGQTAGAVSGVPGAGAAAHGPLAQHRPQHPHAIGGGRAQRGQILLPEQRHPRRCRRAAVRLHHPVAVRGPHGLSLPAVAGDRHARRAGPRAGAAQHHRDAGHHGVGAPARRRTLLCGPVGAVRLPDGTAVAPLPLAAAAVRRQTAAAGVQQGRPGLGAHAGRGDVASGGGGGGRHRRRADEDERHRRCGPRERVCGAQPRL